MSKSILTRLLLPTLLVAWLAVGCAGLPIVRPAAPPHDRLAPHRPALRPATRSLLDDLEPLPQYRIAVRIDVTNLSLAGKMAVTIPPAPGEEPPVEYYFRLYPNLAHYGGDMSIDLVTVNGQGAPFRYAASGTAVHVAVPPTSVAPEQPVTVGFQWRLLAPSWPAGRYSLLGQAEGTLSLPLFYPILAVQDENAPDGWRLEQGLAQGDAAFSEAALYLVTATVPSGLTVISTGSVLAVTESDFREPPPSVEETPAQAAETVWMDWRLASGPVREFALFVSDRLSLAQARAHDVVVNSWYPPGREETGRAAADYAAAALRLYSDLFGPYPYAELDVVAGPLTFRGMEYPGLCELGVDLYASHADELEFRIAHEVAHQWWYNLVGNDPVNAPWLDEGLAEYTTYFYRQRIGGQAAADRLVVDRWQAAYDYVRQQGLDAVVYQPVQAFAGNYETIVYGKAALFFHALHQTLGEERFLALLQAYLERHRFQTVTPEEFLALAEEIGGAAVVDLYSYWITGVDNLAPSEGSQLR